MRSPNPARIILKDEKMKKLLLSTLCIAGFSSGAAFAEQAPKWDFVQASYMKIDIDDTDFEPSGLAISGSALLDQDVFVTGSYAALSEDAFGTDIDFNTMSIGLGYKHSVNTTTDVFGVISYEYAEVEARGEDEDDSGFGLTAGVRSMVTEQVELSGAISYIDIADDSETSFSVGADYFMSSEFSLGVAFSTSSDASTTAINARYSF